MPDAIIIGGGPAGLTASLSLARAGWAVVLVEEQIELGGQYYRRPSPAVVAQHGDHRPAGARLIAAVRAAGVDVRTSTAVWGVDDDQHTLLTAHDGTQERLTANTIVIATGAYERVLPFPGWQLPGVATPGFAQHLAGERVPIGSRVIVAGSGPFLLPVAAALARLGVEVVGVAEAGRPYSLTAGSTVAARYPARLREFAGYLATLVRHRIPIWQERVVVAATSGQHDRIATVTLAHASEPTVPVMTHQVDALCVGYGFRPQCELAQLLGCDVRPDPRSGDLVPIVDQFGRAVQHSGITIWVAGEARGIGGVHAALAEGELVAARILDPTAMTRHCFAAQRRRRRARRFVDWSARLYPAPTELASRLMAALPASTQVCRCEAVTAGVIRSAAVQISDRAALKARTRAGMGPCQGRECSVAVAALSGATGRETARMPIRPVSLESLGALGAPGIAPPPSDGEFAAAAVRS